MPRSRINLASESRCFHLISIISVQAALPSASLLILSSLVAAILTLTVAPSTTFAQTSGAPATTPPPVAYSSVSELNTILDPLKQTSSAMQTDLQGMRIERWKTDPSTKRQMEANVDSIQRNLQSALPEIMSQVSNSPEDMAASFKLYRNLDALYDVAGSVVESAGAWGSKDEFQGLSNDLSGIESARRALGERIQKLAAAKEDELVRLRGQVKTLTAAPPPPPKKIIVDDTEEPPKKPAAKKTTKPKPKPTQPASSNPSQPAAAPNSLQR